MELSYKNWMELREKVPEYLKETINLCAQFYLKANFILNQNVALPRPVLELYGILIKILNNYRGFMKEQNVANKELVADIEKRIDSIFDNILTITTSQGKKNIDLTYLMDNTDIKADYMIRMADTFLDGTIYSGLKETYEKYMQKSIFLNAFITNSIGKLGLPKPVETKGSSGGLDDLMGDDDEDKKEKKSRKKKDKEEVDHD